MIRTQIQLTEEQFQNVKLLAASRGISMAELIRRSIDQTIGSAGLPGWEERKRRALEVVGKYDSGLPDIGLEHDRYLEEAFDS